MNKSFTNELYHIFYLKEIINLLKTNYLTLKNFNLKAFPKTDTELNDIAKAAIIGSNFGPLKNA